ncbi:MAG TPA: TetR/AcrR family transcriptional regulator [Herpetosiphonaceae bacterium]
MTSTRDQIIETTCNLMESQGFHATGLNQIVKASGAPKGSLYYYFPAGKDEIAEASIQWAGRTVAERIRQGMASSDDVADAIQQFVKTIAHYVEVSGFQSGGPLLTVAMETATTNERLNLACREAYTLLQSAFEEKLVAGGYSESRAKDLATWITASIEGGVILSRTYHTGDPLRLIAEQLAQMLRTTS